MFLSMRFAVGLVVTFLWTIATAEGNKSALISAELGQINTTHLSLTIANNGATGITFFAQNSPFDGALQTWLRASRYVNGSEVYLPDGEHAVHQFYLDTTQEDLVNFPPNSTKTILFDATTIFQVPEAGLYSIDCTDRVMVVTDSSDINNLAFSLALVDSSRITVNLTASESPAAASLERRTWTNTNCDQHDKDVVNHTLGISNEYAKLGVEFMLDVQSKYARGMSHPAWTLYFNNHDTERVLKAFRGLAKVTANFNSDENVDLYCRHNPRNGGQCEGRLGAFAKSDPNAYVVLCPKFFKQPECTNCDSKAPSTSNQQVADQPSILLHEFLHIKHISKSTIHDGPHGKVLYRYDQIVDQAREQALASSIFDAPQVTASAYIFFLYTAMEIGRQHRKTGDTKCHGICVLQPYNPSG